MNKVKEIMARILNVKLLLGMLLFSMATSAWADMLPEPKLPSFPTSDASINVTLLMLINCEKIINLLIIPLFAVLIFLWYFWLYRTKTVGFIVRLITFTLLVPFSVLFLLFYRAIGYHCPPRCGALYFVSFVVIVSMTFVSGFLTPRWKEEKTSDSKLKRWLTCGPTRIKNVILLSFTVVLVSIDAYFLWEISKDTYYEKEFKRIRAMEDARYEQECIETGFEWKETKDGFFYFERYKPSQRPRQDYDIEGGNSPQKSW